MTSLDLWTMIALAVAGLSFYLRGVMLKPGYLRWFNAPGSVWGALMVLGVMCGGGVMSILGGFHATGRELVVYSALALTGSVMLVNLWNQRPDPDLMKEVGNHLHDMANSAQAAFQQGRKYFHL